MLLTTCEAWLQWQQSPAAAAGLVHLQRQQCQQQWQHQQQQAWGLWVQCCAGGGRKASRQLWQEP